MPYIQKDIMERIIYSKEEKAAALEEAGNRSLQWVSSSRVRDPLDPASYIENAFRMRFARFEYVEPVGNGKQVEKPKRVRKHKPKGLISYVGFDASYRN